jgi:hypothetical protein
MAKTLGKGLRDFQMATKGLMDVHNSDDDKDDYYGKHERSQKPQYRDQDYDQPEGDHKGNGDEYGDFSREEVEAAKRKAAELDPNTIETQVVTKKQENEAQRTEKHSDAKSFNRDQSESDKDGRG